MYTVIVFRTDGTIEKTEQKKAPAYEQLRGVVGGLIQTVPHMTKYGDYKRGQCFCNEEGQVYNLPFNANATKAWRDALGYDRKDLGTKWSYEPNLFGDVIFYAKS